MYDDDSVTFLLLFDFRVSSVWDILDGIGKLFFFRAITDISRRAMLRRVALQWKQDEREMAFVTKVEAAVIS